MSNLPNAIEKVTVAIVGGGPSGLTAAATVAPLVDGEVLVIEREADTGGIPPAQRSPRLRSARSQALHVGTGLRPASHRQPRVMPELGWRPRRW